MTFRYSFDPIDETIAYAARVSKQIGRRVSVAVCKCNLHEATHFIIHEGSSMSFLKWQDRHGQEE